MRKKLVSTVVIWLALGSGIVTQQGCGRPTFVIAHYSGPVQPRETLGVVRVNGHESLELLALDGESANARIAEDARLHIEILPGKHTLWVQDAKLPDQAAERVSFLAEAGKVYRAVFVKGNGRPSARVYQVDPNSDALLKDVTLLEVPKPLEPSPPANPRAPAPPPPLPPPSSEALPAPSPVPAPPAPGTAPDPAQAKPPASDGNI